MPCHGRRTHARWDARAWPTSQPDTPPRRERGGGTAADGTRAGRPRATNSSASSLGWLSALAFHRAAAVTPRPSCSARAPKGARSGAPAARAAARDSRAVSTPPTKRWPRPGAVTAARRPAHPTTLHGRCYPSMTVEVGEELLATKLQNRLAGHIYRRLQSASRP